MHACQTDFDVALYLIDIKVFINFTEAVSKRLNFKRHKKDYENTCIYYCKKNVQFCIILLLLLFFHLVQVINENDDFVSF